MTPRSFAEAYDSGFDSTVRFLLSKGVKYSEAEELAQSAWARGWEARDQLRMEGRVVPWVNSIAFHQLCNEKRRLTRLAELEECPDTRHTPTRYFAKVEAERLLDQCSPLDHSLLLERYTDGQPIKEIGHAHGMSAVAVRVRLHRARNALRNFADGRQAA